MKMRLTAIKFSGLIIVSLLALGIALFNPIVVSADPAAVGLSSGAQAAKSDSNPADIKTGFKNISDTALYALGAISVLMLIYGGIRYTISAGDDKAVTAAKNTILYAVVGIVVAIMAYAIVNFVIKSLVK
jgi:cytochrome c biogenesis protein CcdA